MNILITDVVDSSLIQGLIKLGYRPDYRPDITQAQVLSVIQEYAGIIITTKIALDRSTIEKAVNLKFIARLGSGLDHVDCSMAMNRGIKLYSTPEANSGAVGEHAIGMLIQMLHHFTDSNIDVKKGNFRSDPFRVTEVEGLTIGILGYGHTGPALAKRLQGFDANLIAYDKYRAQGDGFCKLVSLEDLMAQSDVLSIHLPLTDETQGVINYAFLSACSRLRYIINTSRGYILDIRDLLRWTDESESRWASLDVLDQEEPTLFTAEEKSMFQRLVHHPRIFITPHIAGKSHSTRLKHARVLLKKLKDEYRSSH